MTSPALPGVTRSFTTSAAAARRPASAGSTPACTRGSTTRPACSSVATSPATCSVTRCCPCAPSRGDDPLRARPTRPPPGAPAAEHVPNPIRKAPQHESPVLIACSRRGALSSRRRHHPRTLRNHRLRTAAKLALALLPGRHPGRRPGADALPVREGQARPQRLRRRLRGLLASAVTHGKVAGDGIKKSLLGITQRADGTRRSPTRGTRSTASCRTPGRDRRRARTSGIRRGVVRGLLDRQEDRSLERSRLVSAAVRRARDGPTDPPEAHPPARPSADRCRAGSENGPTVGARAGCRRTGGR